MMIDRLKFPPPGDRCHQMSDPADFQRYTPSKFTPTAIEAVAF